MPNCFRVTDVFDHPATRQVSFIGELVDGQVRPSMVARLPMGTSTTCSGRVLAVEMLSNSSTQVHKMALQFAYQSQEELAFLTSTFRKGEVIELTSDKAD
jgi:hypothetical protein